MEAHRRLAPYFPTISFGTNSMVRLPGPSISQPNVYSFNSTAYNTMYEDLASKDPRLYRANGLLPMLDRNRTIKWGPERWQDWRVGAPRVDERFANDKGARGAEGGVVDVVLTCEERCWEAVLEDLHARGGPLNRPVHVINVDIKDTNDDAIVGGEGILDLAKSLDTAAREERDKQPSSSAVSSAWEDGLADARSGFDERVPEILAEWQERWPNLPVIWTLAWF